MAFPPTGLFRPDPRIKRRRRFADTLQTQALRPIQAPANPYGFNPLAEALQRVTAAYGGSMASSAADQREAEQRAAQAQVMAQLLKVGSARPDQLIQTQMQEPGPGAMMRTQYSIGNDGSQRAIEPLPAGVFEKAGGIAGGYQTALAAAKAQGDTLTQAGLERDIKNRLGEVGQKLAREPNNPELFAEVQQLRSLLDPAGFATEATEAERERVKTADTRQYERGLVFDERAYKASLKEDELERYLADRKEDREWKLEDNAAARGEKLADRKAAIEQEMARAARDRNWKQVDALRDRASKLNDDIAAEGRKIIDAYDFTLDKNVKIPRSEFDKNPSNYGPKGSVEALSKSWVTVTNNEGEQDNLYLTDAEIEARFKAGDSIDKFVSPARRFQNGDIWEEGGKILGRAVFDRWTGDKYIPVLVDGKIVNKAIPPGAVPRTESSLSVGIPSFSQFKKVADATVADEIQIKAYARYMKNQGDANVGVRRLADDLVAYYKTFFDDKSKEMDLSKKELALRIMKGQLQGLLGGARVITVGPGVMTEQDALRVLQNLGGDVTSLQNPEVVAAQISRMFHDKARDYQNNLKFYNYSVQQQYSRRGFEEKSSILDQIDPELFKPEVFLGAPVEDVNSQGGLTKQSQLPPSERISRMSQQELLAINRKSLSRSDLELYIEALRNLK
tara:strand:+ start:4742 stop:6769 length:2028 start_codon:yes stop_codon:yes gene_type:complete